MARIREQTQLLLVKPEVTYGTDSVPTGVNAMSVQNLKQTMIDGSIVERNNIVGFMGSQGFVRTGQWVSLEFDVELQSSGTAGTAPQFGALLRASGMTETVSPGVSTTYAPSAPDSATSATVYYFAGGVRQAAVGCRFTFSVSLNTNGIPVMKFKGVGLYAMPTTVTAPASAPTVPFRAPIGITKQTVTTCSFFSTAVELIDATIDQGGDIKYLPALNTESVEMVARNGMFDVSFFVQDTAMVSTTGWIEKARTNATGAFSFVLGATAGYISEIQVPNMQLRSIDPSFNNGIMMAKAQAAIVPTAANNDFSLTFR